MSHSKRVPLKNRWEDAKRLRSQEEWRTYRVISDYATAYPDPLIVYADENLAVGRRDDEYPGLVWCTDTSGKGGWMPEDCIEGTRAEATARYGYAATELSAQAGCQVTVSHEKNGWAWCTNTSGRGGWLPLAHLNTLI